MNTDYPLSTHVDIAPYSGRRKVPARVLWLQAIVFDRVRGDAGAGFPDLGRRNAQAPYSETVQDPMRIASSRIRTGSRSSWPASARRTSSKKISNGEYECILQGQARPGIQCRLGNGVWLGSLRGNLQC